MKRRNKGLTSKMLMKKISKGMAHNEAVQETAQDLLLSHLAFGHRPQQQ